MILKVECRDVECRMLGIQNYNLYIYFVMFNFKLITHSIYNLFSILFTVIVIKQHLCSIKLFLFNM